jgi:hypothetical protein
MGAQPVLARDERAASGAVQPSSDLFLYRSATEWVTSLLSLGRIPSAIFFSRKILVSMYTAVSPRGKLPWWECHGLSVASLEEDINRHESLWNSTETGREYMKKFKELMAISFVFTSNEHEGTLPLGFEAFQTHEFLKDLIDGKPVMYATDWTWLADGKIKAKGGKKDGRGNGVGRAAAQAIGSEAFNAGRRQLLQHMEALLYLCDSCEPGSQPFTVAMLQETHKRLMSGAVTEDNEQVNAGEFRTTGSCCPGTKSPLLRCTVHRSEYKAHPGSVRRSGGARRSSHTACSPAILQRSPPDPSVQGWQRPPRPYTRGLCPEGRRGTILPATCGRPLECAEALQLDRDQLLQGPGH